MMIKYRYTTLFICLAFLLSSCNPSASKKIVGTWKMQKVYDNSNDVTAQHNPKNDRWIKFMSDGSFESGGQPHGKNGGKWTYNKVENVLYLDSDAGEGDDSYWKLAIQKKEMNWKGTNSSITERFHISFSK
jgi:hypothetical protein